MKKLTVFLVFAMLSFSLYAQNYGEIHGRLIDETTQEPVRFAGVFTEYGSQIIGTTSDEDGRFKLKPLNPGTYTVSISVVSHRQKKITGIDVTPNKITFLNEIPLSNNTFAVTDIVAHKNPLIRPDDPSAIVMLAAEFEHSALIKSPAKLIASMSSEIQVNEAGQFLVRGSRPGSSATFIDGVKVVNGIGSMPGAAIKSLTVYTGGIPAKYGDITGGAVVIETKSYFDFYNEYMAGKR